MLFMPQGEFNDSLYSSESSTHSSTWGNHSCRQQYSSHTSAASKLIQSIGRQNRVYNSSPWAVKKENSLLKHFFYALSESDHKIPSPIDECKELTQLNEEAKELSAPTEGSDEEVDNINSLWPNVSNVFTRLYNQSLREGDEIYQKIKTRTDEIDTIMLLNSKLNSTTGKVDWSNNEEMKQLVARARAVGVDIPEGKFKWNEDELRGLKQNIQTCKESKERVSQLEKVDLQSHMQRSGEYIEWLSTMAKQLHDIATVIIRNIK